MASKELTNKLNKISNVFNIKDVLSIEGSIKDIQRYYKKNKLAYSLLHTSNNMIYMGISRDGHYIKEDLSEHAKFVDTYIDKYDAKKVLELATGRGANSIYLAKQNPEVKFKGVDISQGQLDFAYKYSKEIDNYEIGKSDYHDLNKFEDDSFDIVFIVEALCYSTDKAKVFKNVRRILKKGGHFIVFDGYRGGKKLDRDEEMACNLTEKGMSLTRFEEYSKVISTSAKYELELQYDEDVSKFVLPTMERFEKLSKAFFRFTLLSKVIAKIFPTEFTYNSISGYLMPTLIREGVALYMITVFRKKD